MARTAHGDMRAFACLVDRHQQSVRAMALRFSRRWDVADDVTQEVFLRVCRSASSYAPTALFSTWLYRIVFNLCMDLQRRKRPMSLADDASPVEARAPRDPMIDSERSQAIEDAVHRLPERQRMALILHRFQGLSVADVAATTGWSVSAVESLLVRAYAQLRDSLKEWREP